MDGLIEKAVGAQSPVGARIVAGQDLYWPGPADRGAPIGSILFSSINPKMPGFLKEQHPQFGAVWRQISAEEIQQRRVNGLWK